MFRYSVESFTDNKMVLGIYLGPSIDVGLAMSTNIMNSNVEVVYRLTYRALLLEDLESTEQRAAQKIL